MNLTADEGKALARLTIEQEISELADLLESRGVKKNARLLIELWTWMEGKRRDLEGGHL